MGEMPLGTIMIYFCSYICVHAACQVITCSLPMFNSDPFFEGNWSTTDSGALLGYASLAAGVGFGIWGPFVDYVGPRFGPAAGLGCSLLGNTVGVFLLSQAQTKTQLTIGALLIRLSYSAGFPSEIKGIQLTVPEQYQTTAMSMLGFGSRCGAIVGRALFGMLLQYYSWRTLAQCISFGLAFACVTTVYLVNGKLAEAAKNRPASASSGSAASQSVGQKFAKLGKEPAVWMLATGFSLLCFIMHGDDLMPLLFYGLTGNPLSVSYSAIFPVGGICAMILNATQSHKIKSKEKKEWFYVYLSSIAIAAFAALYFVSCAAGAGGVPMPVVMALIWIAGFTAAPPYYLLANIFAIEYGGEDSATLVSIYELVAFFTKSPVHSQILKIADTSGWENVVLSLLVIAAAAFLTMFLFVSRWHNVLRKKEAFAEHYAATKMSRGVTP
jgi:MFS family permease